MSTLTPLPVGQSPAGQPHLVALTLLRCVPTLVVAGQEEDHPVAVGVAEDPDEEPVVPEAELEEPVAELLAELGGADTHPMLLKNLPHCRPHRAPVLWIETRLDPLPDRLPPALLLIELQGEPGRSSLHPA